MDADDKVKDTELVVIPNSGIAENVDDIMLNVERRFEQFEKVMTLAIKTTSPNDWCDMGGRPFLTSSGAEKVGRRFGVGWKDVRSEKKVSEDEKGNFYFYVFTGIFTFGKDSVEAIGTCSSKDQFFSMKGGVAKPISEVDETNIMKSAYSNMIVNGVSRLLGIRNLRWEQLEEGGIKKSDIPKVEYKKTTQPKTENGNSQSNYSDQPISDAQRKRLFAISTGAGKTEEQVKEYLKAKLGTESTKEIKRKDYENVCLWAEGKIG